MALRLLSVPGYVIVYSNGRARRFVEFVERNERFKERQQLNMTKRQLEAFTCRQTGKRLVYIVPFFRLDLAFVCEDAIHSGLRVVRVVHQGWNKREADLRAFSQNDWIADRLLSYFSLCGGSILGFHGWITPVTIAEHAASVSA